MNTPPTDNPPAMALAYTKEWLDREISFACDGGELTTELAAQVDNVLASAYGHAALMVACARRTCGHEEPSEHARMESFNTRRDPVQRVLARIERKLDAELERQT